MRAFASGCTAMTGVEAVSNGVGGIPRAPVPYARRTLTVIIARWPSCSPGSPTSARPTGSPRPSRASPATRASSPSWWPRSSAGGRLLRHHRLGPGRPGALGQHRLRRLPRLCRPSPWTATSQRLRPPGPAAGLFAGDPRPGSAPAGLLVAFRGITDRLIPLFAVGAFLAFTMSQAGMVVHWRRGGGPRRGRAMASTASAAACTAVTLGVVLVASSAKVPGSRS